MVAKTKKVEELTREIEGLKDQLTRVKTERDRLIQISNDLRADLNRSQRLANELMTKMTSNPVTTQLPIDEVHQAYNPQPVQNVRRSEGSALPLLQNFRGSTGTEKGMFDVISSLESMEPRQARKEAKQSTASPERARIRESSQSPDREALQKYGQQLSNMALEI